MNLAEINKQPQAAKSAHRTTLDIILLIAIIFFGILSVIVLLLPSTVGWIDPLIQRFSKAKQDFPDVSAMLAGKKTATITFKGTMIGEKGAIAIVNGRMATVGAEVEGVRIVEIQDHTLTIEHQGEKFPLSIGQTFPCGGE
jgi:hypothetical protein